MLELWLRIVSTGRYDKNQGHTEQYHSSYQKFLYITSYLDLECDPVVSSYTDILIEEFARIKWLDGEINVARDLFSKFKAGIQLTHRDFYSEPIGLEN